MIEKGEQYESGQRSGLGTADSTESRGTGTADTADPGCAADTGDAAAGYVTAYGIL